MSPISSSASFSATYKNLAEINAFVTESAERAGLDNEAIYAVQHAVDEACSNIIEHAYQGVETGEIECLCISCDNGLIIRFHDHGRHFDPEKIPQPDLNSSIADRPSGGLGLYFIRRLMDEVTFEFSPESIGNTVTMVKYNDQYFKSSLWPHIIALAGNVYSLPNLTEQCECIRTNASQLFGGLISFWMTPNWLKESAFPNQDLFPLNPPTNFISQVVKNKQTILGGSCDVVNFPTYPVENIQGNTSGARCIIAAPLIAGVKLIGAIQIERQEKPFNQVEIKAFEGLANQAALAMSATRQAEIDRWRIEQLALVRSVSNQIANVYDLDKLAHQVTHLILETFRYYYAAIFTYQPEQDFLDFRAASGPIKNNDHEDIPGNQFIQVKLGRGMIGLAASTGFEYLSNDIRQDPRYEYDDALPETLSEVAIPLITNARTLGVLDIQSDVLDAFDDTDMLVLRALADNIAIAVEGARLYSELHRYTMQLASVAEVSNAITSILNFDDLLSEVIRLIKERFGYPYVQIFAVHQALNEITYIAGSTLDFVDLADEGIYYDINDPNGLIPWATRNGESVIVNDVSKDPRYKPSGYFPEQINSELVVPLIFGGQTQGILDVQSHELHAFTEDDRALFVALADHIAIAMRNAQLYRSEAWRRQVADSMHKVAGLLSADISLDHLFNSILDELGKAIPSDTAAIWLVEENSNDEESPPHFQLAALKDIHNMLESEIIEYALDQVPENRLWLAKALDSQDPLIRTHGTGDIADPFGSILGFEGNYSAIAAPLRVGDTSLGVLSLAHHSQGRFGTESQAMTATFASYAAIAIENARLYEASHDQAWVSTVLLQVAEATQSLTNIVELLATVVQITPLLVGVNACALMMWDEDANAFIPGAAHGLSLEQQDDFDQWVVKPGEEPAFDQLRMLKSPILLPHWSFAKSLTGKKETINQDVDPTDYPSRPLVLFPMVVQDTILGGLLVDFAGTEGQYDLNLDNDEFLHDEKLDVIQGIAHQTAIAVENIRLLKAQKEEAYVSVALLQVAQAVVSLINLNEILETIVRIAPILVGVNRCAIYLWDDLRSGFWLTQSYGLPRELEDYLETRLYIPEEFPLLDQVYKTNKLIHVALDGSSTQPSEWEGIKPDEYENYTLLSDDLTLTKKASVEYESSINGQSFTEEVLRHEGNFLYAFPLSVKGSVLGIFLAEEALNTTSELSSYHVRLRRLEILTGITQQAALAIQNDRLQSEVVERERLEREMQLARSIQQTFLPQQIPSIPNWDLDMRWRTARQVGGDFYDLIELPNGKLGLVIADVADKGMPAALFMTLVRTLIRASVHGKEAPSEVLEEVNHLMIPDTQNGMFVTVIYGVLSLDTGDFVYTNAGHNLPILLHTTNKEVSLLSKGGIALGILDNIHLEDHKICLAPGDCIIFYTDGVTEAFSPDDLMFGEERLLETINTSNMESASTVLDAIDHAVNDFIGDLPRADDLTIVAIRRVGL